MHDKQFFWGDLSWFYKNNVKYFENKGKKPFQCDICKKIFSHKIDLTWHSEKAHDCKKYSKCGPCNIDFTNVLEVSKHLEKEHFGQHKFQCDLCNVIYYQKVDLNEHNSTIHITSAHEESMENENVKQKRLRKKILCANIAIRNSVPIFNLTSIINLVMVFPSNV